MNINRIKKAADAVKWLRRSDLLDDLLRAINEELGPIGACKSSHLVSPDEEREAHSIEVTISRKEWDWLKLRSRRCLAWDQWAQEEMTEIPEALRHLDPTPRQVVEVPELTDAIAKEMEARCKDSRTPLYALAFHMYRWFCENLRHAPAPDTVTVPREEWEAAEFVLRAWNGGWCEDRMISPFYAWNTIRKDCALRSAPPATNQKEST